MGLSQLQLANRAHCPVEVVIHTEFGLPSEFGDEIQNRLATAYCLAPRRFSRLVRHALARFARRQGEQRRALFGVGSRQNVYGTL
jgi:hypothetical protein